MRWPRRTPCSAIPPRYVRPTTPAVRAWSTESKTWSRTCDQGGWPSQVDSTGYELGVNLAATPGAVIYRNRLIELIEYAPQTERVFGVPLLFCPPWINKYYIMDLAPKRSLIEWAVQHGHTCFAISYRNPDSSMRDLSFDDYLHLGFQEAVKVAREVINAHQVNLVSLCLGGTLSAVGLAYNAASRRKTGRVNSSRSQPVDSSECPPEAPAQDRSPGYWWLPDRLAAVPRILNGCDL